MFGERGEFAPRQERYREIETPNAKYRLLYGLHAFKQDTSALNGVDGVILEGVGKPDDFEKDIHNPDDTVPQMSSVIKYCWEQKKPIYSMDIPIQNFKSREELTRFWVTSSTEATIALLLVRSLIKDLKKPRDISRREVLRKFMTAGKVAAVSYLASPMLGDWADLSVLLSPDKTELENERRLLRGINEKVHPEIYGKILSLRNLIFAQRAETVAAQERRESQQKPTYAMVLGAAHTGVEDALHLTEQERVKRIKSYFPDSDLSALRRIPKVSFDNSGSVQHGVAPQPRLEFIEDNNF